MRVVVLTDEHPPAIGGVAVFTGRVVAELVRRGHEVRVLARGRPGPVAVPGSRLTPVRGPSFGRFGGEWLAARGVPALLGADRILATTWPAATGVARLGLRFDVVGHGSDLTRPPVRPRAFGRCWSAAERRFVVSRYLAERVAGPVEVLPAAVTPRERPVEPAQSGRFGLVARATDLKGGDRFVRLVAAAGVDGVVVGDGPALPAWRAAAHAAGARITFLGARSPAQVETVVAGLDLLCLLPRARADGSGAEGLGLALVEAAALGVPVVGCRTGGVPEAVGPGLVLDDPDDAVRSAARVRGWWTPERGAEAWRWCRETHGVGRAVDRWLSRPGSR